MRIFLRECRVTDENEDGLRVGVRFPKSSLVDPHEPYYFEPTKTEITPVMKS